MVAPRNTCNDLFSTRSANQDAPQSLPCPICGNNLTLQSSSGVQPILTPYCRDLFNRDLDCYRAFLAFVAYCLNRRNTGIGKRSPVRDPGMSNTDVRRWLREFSDKEEIDESAVESLRSTGLIELPIFQVLDQVLGVLSDREFDEEIDANVPDLERLREADPEQFAKLVRYVLVSIEPSTRFATVAELVLAQEPVQKWAALLKSQAPEHTGKLQQLVNATSELVPDDYKVLFLFFAKLAERIDDEATFNSQSNIEALVTEGVVHPDADVQNDTTSLRKSLSNRLERACVIVALLTMHGNPNGESELDKYFSVADRRRSGRGTYQLPETAKVSFSLIRSIFKSVEIVKFNILGISTAELSVLRSMHQHASEFNNAVGDSASYQWLLDQLTADGPRELISKLFGFACNGKPADQISVASTGPAGTTSVRLTDRQICGWYPKPEPTLGVVFIGSPGAGKSFAFFAACAVITGVIARLGAFTLKPSPRSDANLEAIRYQFQSGMKPDRTGRNTHHAVEFTLSAQDSRSDGGKSLHLVFSDIAGEISVQPMREGTTDSIVANTLSNAHIIVCFMDFSIDPDFGRRIATGPNKSKFSRFIEARKEARKKRMGDNGRPVSDISQFDFVRRISDLSASHRDFDKDSPYFMVVLPKADLYGDQDQWQDPRSCFFLHKLFSDLFKDRILYEELSETDNDSANTLQRLTSMGGSTWKSGDASPIRDARSPYDKSNAIVRLVTERISRQTLDGLLSFGDALKPDGKLAPSLEIETEQWGDAMVQLKEDLYRVFGADKTFFLPCSAQGRQEVVVDGSETQEQLPRENGHADPGAPRSIPSEAATQSHLDSASGQHPQMLTEFLFLAPMMLAFRDYQTNLAAHSVRTPRWASLNEVEQAAIPNQGSFILRGIAAHLSQIPMVDGILKGNVVSIATSAEVVLNTPIFLRDASVRGVQHLYAVKCTKADTTSDSNGQTRYWFEFVIKDYRGPIARYVD